MAFYEQQSLQSFSKREEREDSSENPLYESSQIAHKINMAYDKVRSQAREEQISTKADELLRVFEDQRHQSAIKNNTLNSLTLDQSTLKKKNFYNQSVDHIQLYDGDSSVLDAELFRSKL